MSVNKQPGAHETTYSNDRDGKDIYAQRKFMKYFWKETYQCVMKCHSFGM